MKRVYLSIFLIFCAINAFAGPPAIPPATGLTNAASVAITGGTITGTAKGSVTAASTGSLSAAQMKNTIINNYGQTDDATQSLDSFVSGIAFTAVLGTTVAKYWRLDPNGSELIYLVSSGTATSCGAGKYVGIASAAAGATLSCVSFQTGASAYSLLCAPVSGPWACEP